MTRATALLSAAALVAACGSRTPSAPPAEDVVPAPPDEVAAPALTTDADRYGLARTPTGWETEIPFTYENPTDGPVFVVTCLRPNPPTLEKWVDGRWVTAWSPVVPACLGPVLRLEAGERHSDVLEVSAGFPGSDFYPKLEVEDPEGVYRLALEVLSSYDPDRYPFGPPLPENQRVSNTFELVEAD